MLTFVDKIQIRIWQKQGQFKLDEHKPDWRQSINVDELEMTDSTACILGQVYCSYTRGLMDLDADGESFGFDLDPDNLKNVPELPVLGHVDHEEYADAEAEHDQYIQEAWSFLSELWVNAATSPRI